MPVARLGAAAFLACLFLVGNIPIFREESFAVASNKNPAI
jgi:hypothetical protein